MMRAHAGDDLAGVPWGRGQHTWAPISEPSKIHSEPRTLLERALQRNNKFDNMTIRKEGEGELHHFSNGKWSLCSGQTGSNKTW